MGQSNDSQFPDGRPPADQPRWRRDFPIDVPQDNYVARRDFTKFLVLTSAAFVVGQFWIATQNVLRKARGRPGLQRIAALDEIAIGQTISFNYPGAHDPCLLIRRDQTRLVAYGQKCTHLSCAVQPELNQETGAGCLACPCHHGFFDLETGRPTAGPPRRPLPRIVLEIKQGIIYATGVELST